MKFDYGTIIAIVAALLFYLRLIILQRQRVKRYQAYKTQPPKKTKGNQKQPQQKPPSITDQLGFRIDNWYVLAVGIVVILFSAFLSASPLFSPQARSFWWIPLVAGIFILNYSIR